MRVHVMCTCMLTHRLTKQTNSNFILAKYSCKSLSGKITKIETSDFLGQEFVSNLLWYHLLQGIVGKLLHCDWLPKQARHFALCPITKSCDLSHKFTM